MSGNTRRNPNSKSGNKEEIKSQENNGANPKNDAISKVFVPEKIVIVMDLTTDEEATSFRDNEDNEFISFEMLKDCVEHFVLLKTHLNKNHEFALITLEENKAKLECNLTSSVKEFIKSLKSVKECRNEDVFDLNSIFKELFKITSEVRLENCSENSVKILRTILIYNRSYTQPKISLTPKIKSLLHLENFFLDILISHEAVNVGNNCANIIETLQTLDSGDKSYFFTVERDLKATKTCFGKLLAHPHQRPLQKNWNCAIQA